MKQDISIIGSGFSSLSAACYLAKAGNNVTIYEKNTTIGGRTRQLKKEGFCFDMGPTWYWMPDVFERFFNDFNKKTEDFYELEKLDPAYGVYFGKSDVITIEDSLEKICNAFEKEESGSSIKLRKFINEAKNNYNIAIKDLVYRPGISPLELITPKTLKNVRLFFNSISKKVRGHFTNPKLISIMEFPVLFLGAKPSNTPAFYSFMNYADFGLGTFHPKKGMYSVITGIKNLAEELGVIIKTSQNVEKLIIKNDRCNALIVNSELVETDLVLSGADYHHTESLLDKKYRQYSERYWGRKTFAPSALLFFVGFNKKLKNIYHHTLFFDSNFETHSNEIYDDPRWPSEPLFYASFPSKTDQSVSPKGKEAGIFLIPLAPGLVDIEEVREEYFEKIIKRFEYITDQDIRKDILFYESYSINDFITDYNSYKGNAYGLANTLTQTAFLRPKLKK